MTIRAGTRADAATVARLHASAIHEGFLPTLGPAFLTTLYRRIVRHPGSFLLVAEGGDGVDGFIAGTDDVGALYKSFAVRDGVVAGLVAAPRIVRSWRRVWETVRYPAGEHDLPPAELLAVAVDPSARGQGLGRELVGALQAEFTQRHVAAARVTVAANNDNAIALYERCGFRRAAHIEVHEGTPSEVLVWS
jgi:ribosomal protein S18 acetylase RimI-like enzyme